MGVFQATGRDTQKDNPLKNTETMATGNTETISHRKTQKNTDALEMIFALCGRRLCLSVFVCGLCLSVSVCGLCLSVFVCGLCLSVSSVARGVFCFYLCSSVAYSQSGSVAWGSGQEAIRCP